MNGKALIAMSGGVDSSVAALLMLEQGYACIGVTMKLFDNEAIGVTKEHSCCSLDDVLDARSVAAKLGMPYFVFNFADRFKKDVIDRFVNAYMAGATPNPCIDCNRYLKFDQLFERALSFGCNCIATGHYARTFYDAKKGRYLLLKAIDPLKDQSYVLYALTQHQLAHVRFPLGILTKPQVRALAETRGFVNAHKHDSQDICFVTGSYADFIERYTGRKFPPGLFVSDTGQVLGEHKGIIHYTIGQRKGLGLALPEPMYVKKIDVKANTVILTTSTGLLTREVAAENINLIDCASIDSPRRVTARIRYHQQEQPGTVRQTADDRLEFLFDEPQRAVTPGQSLVLYDGEVVVGGGTIC